MQDYGPFTACRQPPTTPALPDAWPARITTLLAVAWGLACGLTPGAAWSDACAEGDVIIDADVPSVCAPGMPPTDSLTINPGVTVGTPLNLDVVLSVTGLADNTISPVTHNGSLIGQVHLAPVDPAALLTLGGNFTNNGRIEAPTGSTLPAGRALIEILDPDPAGAGLANTAYGYIAVPNGSLGNDFAAIAISATPLAGLPNPAAGLRLVNEGQISILQSNGSNTAPAIRVTAENGTSLRLDLINNGGSISAFGGGPGIQVTGNGAVLHLDSTTRTGFIYGQPGIALSGGATLNASYAGSIFNGADGGTDSHLEITGSTSSSSAFTRFATATIHDDVRLDLGHDLQATTLDIGQGHAGVLAQSAGAITATTVNIKTNGRYLYAGGNLTAHTLSNAGTLEIAPGLNADLPVTYYFQQPGGRIRLNVDASGAISTLTLPNCVFDSGTNVLEVSVDSTASLQVGDTFPAVIYCNTRSGYPSIARDDSNSVDFAVVPTTGGAINLTVVTQNQINQAPQAGNVSLSGNAVVGGMLSLTYDYSDTDGDMEGASRFQWQRGGVDIAGATGRSYTLTAADAGQAISVIVTPEAATGTTPGQPSSSAAQTVNNPPLASNLQVDASPLQGQTLTASYVYSDAENDPEGASRIRWLRNGKPIYRYDSVTGKYSYVTGTSYTTGAQDIGQAISFELTPVAASGSTTGILATSPAVTVVSSGSNPASGGGGSTGGGLLLLLTAWLARRLRGYIQGAR